MDKGIVAEIDADMGICLPALVKEQKIADLHIFFDWQGDGPERLRAVGHVQASGLIAVLHQAAAVEARGAVSFVLVGSADHGDCGEGGLLTCCCGDMVGLFICRCRNTVGFLADIGSIAKWGHSGYRGACGENADSEKNSALKKMLTKD